MNPFTLTHRHMARPPLMACTAQVFVHLSRYPWTARCFFSFF